MTALLVLPGALYTWGIERVIGHWGVGLVDRLLRFAGISACFQVLLAPLTYHAYRFYFPDGTITSGDLPLGFWLVLLAYVFGPLIAGLSVGHGLKRQFRWAQVVAGRHRAPRAWDVVFGLEKVGYVRLSLKDADQGEPVRWLAGWYDVVKSTRYRSGSYSARYPAPQDLYLAQTVACDKRTGTLVGRGGRPVLLDGGLLIRWEEVRYLYFTPMKGPRRAVARDHTVEVD